MLNVGIDLVCIDRFTGTSTPGGLAFYNRVFTPQEQESYGHQPTLLALCFSAKEAISKVLGTGLTLGKMDRVTCLSIQILKVLSDNPQVILSGTAMQMAIKLGLEKISLCHKFMDRNIVMCAVGSTNVAEVDPDSILKNIMSTWVE